MPLVVIQRDLGTERVASHKKTHTEEKWMVGKRVRRATDPLSSLPFSPARTGCVDLTITNLLEGAVAFMPEDITEGTQSHPTASAPKVRPRKWSNPKLGVRWGTLHTPYP